MLPLRLLGVFITSLAIVFSFSAMATEEMGYELRCETETRLFTLEIADKNISTGLATLKIYDRVSKFGSSLKATTSVNLDVVNWGQNSSGRYIEGFSYQIRSVVRVEVKRKMTEGFCERMLAGGTRYKASISSNQPMLEFQKNTSIECESSRIYIGWTPTGGGTTM